MRILRLDVGAIVTLHPAITVVSGLAGDQRARFLDALGSVTTGEGAAAGGLVEVSGVLLDFDRATLELLDVLGPESVDIVVRATDLPGGAAERGERAAEQAKAEIDRITRRLAVARASAEDAGAPAGEPSGLFSARARSDPRPAGSRNQLEDELARMRTNLERLVNARQQAQRRRDRAERAFEDQRAAVTAAVEAARVAEDDLAAAAEADDRLLVRIDEVTGRLDPDAADALAAARAGLAGLERRRDEAVRAAAEPRRHSREYRRVEAALASVGVADTAAVEGALEPLAHKAAAREPVPDAEALADEWERVAGGLLKAEVMGPESPGGLEELEAARNRLEEARARVEEAEKRFRGSFAVREQVEQLIQAHDALIAARDRADRRLGGSRSRKRLEQARAEEQRLLDELGFATWTDFLIGAGGPRVDGEAVDALAAARHDLVEAQDAWEALAPRVEAELARADLLSRRQTLRDQAARLLGGVTHDDDPVPALRALRGPVPASSEELDRLRSALGDVGVEIDHGASPVAAAEEWLEAQRRAAAQRDALAEQLAGMEAAEAEQAEAALADTGPPVTDEDLEAARLAVIEAKERLVRHEDAEMEMDHLAIGLDSTVDRLKAAEAEREARVEAAQQAATSGTASAAVELDTAEAALAEAADACEAAEAALAELGDQLAAAEVEASRQAEQEAAAERATTESAAAARRVAALEAELAAAERALAETQAPEPAGPDLRLGRDDRAARVAEVEWYLLARLAAQRSVGLAGSLPLVLDDALAGLQPPELAPVLGQLERIAASVQVVVITDDPTTVEWAARAGEGRAAVVSAGSEAR